MESQIERPDRAIRSQPLSFWDRAAASYARQPIKDPVAYERKLEHVLQNLHPTDTVLEVGCGTGSTALMIARGVAAVTATDISGAMIDIARSKLATDDPGNLRFLQADACEILDQAKFDAVMAFSLLHLVDEPAAVLASIHTQLAHGGLLFIKTPCLRELHLPMRLLVRTMSLLGIAPRLSFFSIAEHAMIIERAGFVIEDQVCLDVGKRSPFVVARKLWD